MVMIEPIISFQKEENVSIIQIFPLIWFPGAQVSETRWRPAVQTRNTLQRNTPGHVSAVMWPLQSSSGELDINGRFFPRTVR